MSKGLEALERIVELAKYDVDLSYDFKDLQNDKDIIEKELKALEIIKNKGLNVAYLKSWLAKSTYEEYQEEHKGTIYEITKEEYDLLKEVLL